jgi:hypothetical protein
MQVICATLQEILYFFIFLLLYRAFLITSELLYQLMHYLLDIKNVKIYIRILYNLDCIIF